MIRYVLFELAKIDVRKYEMQNSLLIINSGRAYFGSSIDLVSFVKSLVNYADQIGKNGVSTRIIMLTYPNIKGGQSSKNDKNRFPS
jgi:hypothetical protein